LTANVGNGVPPTYACEPPPRALGEYVAHAPAVIVSAAISAIELLLVFILHLL
jgi:hypothetical protein